MPQPEALAWRALRAPGHAGGDKMSGGITGFVSIRRGRLRARFAGATCRLRGRRARACGRDEAIEERLEPAARREFIKREHLRVRVEAGREAVLLDEREVDAQGESRV